MKTQYRLLLLSLVAGLAALPLAALEDPPGPYATCSTTCTCKSSCTASCFANSQGTAITTCGNFGVCKCRFPCPCTDPLPLSGPQTSACLEPAAAAPAAETALAFSTDLPFGAQARAQASSCSCAQGQCCGCDPCPPDGMGICCSRDLGGGLCAAVQQCTCLRCAIF